MSAAVLDPSLAIEALRGLAGVDVATLDRDGLDRLIADKRAVRAFDAHVEVLIARRAKELAAEGRSECAEGVLADNGRCSTREARAAAERERACHEMPGFESALAAGAVSTGHVDALAAATHSLSEEQRSEFAGYAEDLLSHATGASVEDFGRECRTLAQLLSRDDGTSRLEHQRPRPRRRLDPPAGPGPDVDQTRRHRHLHRPHHRPPTHQAVPDHDRRSR